MTIDEVIKELQNDLDKSENRPWGNTEIMYGEIIRHLKEYKNLMVEMMEIINTLNGWGIGNTPHYFCHRCGKRLKKEGLHTCSPPLDKDIEK